MQCKDIPDIPVLEFLRAFEGRWCHWYELGTSWDKLSVRHAMPENTPAKLVLAKMKMLMRRGLVTGCGCGCRGDFEITALGQEYLTKHVQKIQNSIENKIPASGAS